MRYDKISFLLLLQFIILVCLLFMDGIGQPEGFMRGGLFTVLFVITGTLFVIRLKFLRKVKSMVVELRRAIHGNFHTRLLAKNDHLFNEVIFSINELIDQLERVQVQTIKSKTARRSLLSSISHDIRTPLTSMIGYVDALKDDVATSEGERREYLEIISKKSGGLKQLIDEIFHMAKLDADEIPLQLEWLDFAEMARESLIEFLPELKKYQMELKVCIPEDKCLIVADRLSLLRIMNNMIKNAVQYGKKGKVLGIELTENEKEYQLCIWDKGAGISKEDVPHVFDRMYRTDRARNSLLGGSGLGLAIAKSLVEKHSGRIWVESEPEIKTIFGFSIPKQKHEIEFKN
ncbi:sensor histidine kinase [Brevibacillus laterosporus]|uniref:histidine kinase n=1 Tax=Brevibacillus laterosporus TaxID=1465 RepID=A0AAP8Q9B7_BRELA|nr:HAMP domain-containing sensor histidine kinase [Brevibacillus laterosporus]MCR8983052.1 HAMP domain-containing histidine kinase [Brevibacillus laterosporus]MCZ0810208.1 HAMP domain-containing sensor histidine kinase [Brevibacillus laterosporus]MCZ0828825.1 HAMP domain-containing sensor histidine kinase [Brevibacillus laterosporus]MCZ0852849.1 HAMP domain-containing sensor histidine kinase [Brevibacillus laterosporus]PPA90277.1 two-component sensor histidine kinase [Brevibacillus laterosporu